MPKNNLHFPKIVKEPDFLIGIFFMTVFIASGISYMQQKLWYEFFWLSNHWALINGIAFLARSRFMFSYIVALGIVPEIFWVVDFAFMATGQPFLGITNYWFDANYPFSLKVTALQHFLNPFASIYGVARFGFHKKAWIGATVHGMSILLISLVFFGKDQNVNCVWKNCIPVLPIRNFIWQILLVSGMILHIFLVTRFAKFIMKKKGKAR